MLSPRQNFINYLKGEPTEWRPSSLDYLQFGPEEIVENVVRGFVDQQEPFDKSKYGGMGYFGCEWIYEKEVGGSMEVATLFEDLDGWEEKIQWPNLDDIDWEAIRERNKDYLNTDKLIRSTIFTGFFERLISFLGFENAAMCLVDEDCEDDVHGLFSRLADIYIDFMGRMHRYFNVELFELHDDWGTQRAPMFSKNAHTQFLLPYVKRVCDAAHEMGCFVEMHSCGAVGPLFDNFVAAGIDTWRGQPSAVDKKALVEEYGDRFHFGAWIRPQPGCTPEEAVAVCKDFKEKFDGKNVWLIISDKGQSPETVAAMKSEMKGWS
ncbi:MAG: hypothetical protein MJ067_01400 [Oscillospiraceae bacterium]|nr:hypothetical protein [Oscillospiraceae bacterium]